MLYMNSRWNEPPKIEYELRFLISMKIKKIFDLVIFSNFFSVIGRLSAAVYAEPYAI